jgi:hypothetical protein
MFKIIRSASNKQYHKNYCKECLKQYNRTYNKNLNKEQRLKAAERSKKHAEKYYADPINAAKRNLCRRTSWSKYRAERKELHVSQKKNMRDTLHPTYIKGLLVVRNKALSAKDIPDSLVELKRQELILKRKLKNHE